jgi:hypothetical protein
LRRRADELQVSRLNLDALCGLPDGYVAKLLAPQCMKAVGPKSLGALLGVMGCKLVLEEDPATLAQIQGRLKKRSVRQVRANGRKRHTPWLISRKNAREIAALMVIKTTPAARSIRARRAAIARWRKAE